MIKQRVRYTGVDLALLGLAAVVSGIIFSVTWFIYDVSTAIGGIYAGRLVAYGLWFIGAPLAASLIRKPLSAFLGEFLGALVETIIPTPGGFTNLIYGFTQGLASELAYFIFRYRKWGKPVASLSGALAAFPCIALDAVLFGEIYTLPVMSTLLAAAIVSGAIYGLVAVSAVEAVRRI